MTETERILGKNYVLECFELRGSLLFWRERPLGHFGNNKSVQQKKNLVYAGQPAGGGIGDGYLYTQVSRNGRRLKLLNHRVIWMMHTGEWPQFVIDHINRDRSDNRIENLRDVPRDVNSRNNGKSGGTGLYGAYPRQRSTRFKAHVVVARKVHYLGTFDTPEEASAVATAYRSLVQSTK